MNTAREERGSARAAVVVEGILTTEEGRLLARTARNAASLDR